MLLAFLIQHDLSSDYLDELGLGALREHGAELIRIVEAVLQNGYLNQLFLIECLSNCLRHFGRKTALSDLEHRFQVPGKAFQIRSLFACHSYLSFQMAARRSDAGRIIYSNQI